MLCSYGCGQEASFQFKNGKWCCSTDVNYCPAIILKSILVLNKKKHYFDIKTKKLYCSLKKKLKKYNINIKEIKKRIKAEIKQQIEENKNLTVKSEYEIYLESEKWKIKSNRIKKRDNYTCQCCSSKDIELNVHHKTYERIYYEEDEDLTTLCRDCHEKEHGIQKTN